MTIHIVGGGYKGIYIVFFFTPILHRFDPVVLLLLIRAGPLHLGANFVTLWHVRGFFGKEFNRKLTQRRTVGHNSSRLPPLQVK